MSQDLIMREILLKEHAQIPLNSRICIYHDHPMIYPIEYEECPACGCERITRVTLGKD